MQTVIADEHPRSLWFDGSIVPWQEAKVHVNAVGHASVSSIFEGIKAHWSAEREQLYVFRLDEHLQRLVDGARIVRLECMYSVDDLRGAITDLLVANEARSDTYIRPWLFARGTIYEHLVPVDAPTHCAVDTWRFVSRLRQERSCRACVSSWRRIGESAMPARLKVFSNYHNGRLAMIEAHTNGYEWPILLNDRGKVSEAPGACIAMVRRGRLVTPTVTNEILESITRETILELAAKELGVVVDEREIDRTELYVADELFFVGTGWEILPIVEVDGLRIGDGRMGPVAAALDRVYDDALRGNLDKYARWLTPVWPEGERKERETVAVEVAG